MSPLENATPVHGEIEEAVIAYLQRHPQAADTLDGIVTWWLPLQRYELGRTKISRVLGQMVDAGLLRRDRLPDGGDIFALNQRMDPP
jgi:hypothetical protein